MFLDFLSLLEFRNFGISNRFLVVIGCTQFVFFNVYNVLVGFELFIFRISHQRCSLKKSVLGNFAKFAGKHLCQSLFFNKVRPATLLKNRLWHRCFPVNFAKFLRTLFFHRTPLDECFCILRYKDATWKLLFRMACFCNETSFQSTNRVQPNFTELYREKLSA